MDTLERFVDAQRGWYSIAYREMEDGEKNSHWMWFIFPQLKGLGFSENAKRYGIKDREEAKAYYNHPLLGKRLVEISKVLMNLESDDAEQIMGSGIDAIKLKSCMTLFDEVTSDPIFSSVLDKFFDNGRDMRTVQLLKEEKKV
ncbi:MAG: DUF1810 domain-containing protein [Sphaerochaetaceae bacterium]|nr:DUF1810 domain-containing protein [Sphaerochaetaceae bacterium]